MDARSETPHGYIWLSSIDVAGSQPVLIAVADIAGVSAHHSLGSEVSLTSRQWFWLLVAESPDEVARRMLLAQTVVVSRPRYPENEVIRCDLPGTKNGEGPVATANREHEERQDWQQSQLAQAALNPWAWLKGWMAAYDLAHHNSKLSHGEYVLGDEIFKWISEDPSFPESEKA